MQWVQAVLTSRLPAMAALDGAFLGRTPALCVLPGEGEAVLSLTPLRPGFLPAAFPLAFSHGRLTACPPDLAAYHWGGELIELHGSFRGLPEERPRRFPFTLARRPVPAGLGVLYYEDGLWFTLENGGRVLYGTLLHETAMEGELLLLGGLAVALGRDGESARGMALNDRLEQVLSIGGAAIRSEGDGLVLTERLGTDGWLTRETAYRLENGRASPLSPAFSPTQGVEAEADSLPLRFCEAVQWGCEALAGELLSPDLAASLPPGAMGEFLGPFTHARAHPAHPGVIGVTEGGYAPEKPLRQFRFQQSAGKIVNISEDT